MTIPLTTYLGTSCTARRAAQELNKSKLVFISINVNYEYSGKFDWGRKPRAPAPRAARAARTPQHALRGARATGRFLLGVGGPSTPRKNLPVALSPPPRGGEGVSQMCPGLLWGSRAQRKVPVEFYIQMSGRENRHFANTRSRTLCTARSCARTRRIRGCLLYTSPSPRDLSTSRMPSSA